MKRKNIIITVITILVCSTSLQADPYYKFLRPVKYNNSYITTNTNRGYESRSRLVIGSNSRENHKWGKNNDNLVERNSYNYNNTKINNHKNSGKSMAPSAPFEDNIEKPIIYYTNRQMGEGGPPTEGDTPIGDALIPLMIAAGVYLIIKREKKIECEQE